eukprot:TRINITY_DN10905_c0_g1_i1.p1 TRINITY_DN10905_c0_g1~~TRINITY_DN10905_c0_g1_i1.p1  ORF type:complete len:393 (+),score=72.66 TRINITY_DN10905_c0_g1_i1:73-1251(+)
MSVAGSDEWSDLEPESEAAVLDQLLQKELPLRSAGERRDWLRKSSRLLGKRRDEELARDAQDFAKQCLGRRVFGLWALSARVSAFRSHRTKRAFESWRLMTTSDTAKLSSGLAELQERCAGVHGQSQDETTALSAKVDELRDRYDALNVQHAELRARYELAQLGVAAGGAALGLAAYMIGRRSFKKHRDSISKAIDEKDCEQTQARKALADGLWGVINHSDLEQSSARMVLAGDLRQAMDDFCREQKEARHELAKDLRKTIDAKDREQTDARRLLAKDLRRSIDEKDLEQTEARDVLASDLRRTIDDNDREQTEARKDLASDLRKAITDGAREHTEARSSESRSLRNLSLAFESFEALCQRNFQRLDGASLKIRRPWFSHDSVKLPRLKSKL